MKLIIVLLLLISLSWSYVYVASGLTTVVSNGTATLNTFPSYNPVHFASSPAKWIWNQNWQKTPLGQSLAFFGTFSFRNYCACSGKQLKLRVSADATFRAFFNGQFVLTGTNYLAVFEVIIPQALINPEGTNTLVVVAANNDQAPTFTGYNPAGVIFEIIDV